MVGPWATDFPLVFARIYLLVSSRGDDDEPKTDANAECQ